MDTSLDKFDKMLLESHGENPEGKYSFGIFLDYATNIEDKLYLEEMANRGKLKYYELCVDDGHTSDITQQIRKSTLFYRKNLNIRENVYVFRLPFLKNKISLIHGTKLDISYRSVKLTRVEEKKAKEMAEKAIKYLFEFYVKFIRCHITKSFTSHEDIYNILEHYSNNDGIFTIPDFAVEYFNKTLDIKDIPFPGGLDEENCKAVREFYQEYSPKITLLNPDTNEHECPFCQTKNVSTGNIVICIDCERTFLVE